MSVDRALIYKFLDWLEKNTDFSEWHLEVKVEVEQKLKEILNEPPPEYIKHRMPSGGYYSHPNTKMYKSRCTFCNS